MRLANLNNRGTLKIKNVSDDPYIVEEIGHPLASGEAVDLLDSSLPSFYVEWEAANRLVTETPESKLYRDIQQGKIQVIENLRPGV